MLFSPIFGSPLPDRSFTLNEEVLITPEKHSGTLPRFDIDTEALVTVVKKHSIRGGHDFSHRRGLAVNYDDGYSQNFGDIATPICSRAAGLQMSPLFEISIEKPKKWIFNKNGKTSAILQAFRTGTELSMSQLMKLSALTDTNKNRALINSLVVDGQLLLTGRSRSTRYRLSAP